GAGQCGLEPLLGNNLSFWAISFHPGVSEQNPRVRKTEMKRVTLLVIVLAATTIPARADMVTERWGVAGPVQHAGTVRHEAAADKGTLLHFDLKALPKGATVYRARLVLVPERAEPYGLSGHMHHGAAMGIHVDYRTGFEVV